MIKNSFFLLFLLCSILTMTVSAVNVPISLFPLQHYKQSINYWLNPHSPIYNKRLISQHQQQWRFNQFYNHLFNTDKSYQMNWQWGGPPWNRAYITKLFRQTPTIKILEMKNIEKFDNSLPAPDVQYGENFRPYKQQWIKEITYNVNLNQFTTLKFTSQHRAITVHNLSGRILPTNDVAFSHFTLAGQGYPFDNLQSSAVWAGTPVYIIAQTRDKAWDYIVTPSFLTWVPSTGVARVDNKFIKQWQAAAKKQLGAIVHTKTSVLSHGAFQFYGYVGAVFPINQFTEDSTEILIPVKSLSGMATIERAELDAKDIVKMPLVPTRHSFSRIMETLVNRPYGWGGMYFYNDCSAEIKSLFTPFGIWMPRNTSNQIHAGKIIDKSQLRLAGRLHYLLTHGHSLMTEVYIGGHAVLYVGDYYATKHKKIAITYQNIWGLKPSDKSRREVIGESLFFPLLKHYPEDPELQSLANYQHFVLVNFDQQPEISNSNTIDVGSLMG